MLKTKKFYQEKGVQLGLLSRGLSGWDENRVLGCKKNVSLSELKTWLEEKISTSGDLAIVDEKHAKMTCVLFSEYHDSKNISGCACFIANYAPSEITYCDISGDKKIFYFNDTNSVKVFVR